MYEVTINRSFSAAHTLRDVGGKCESLHGHNFRVEVTVAGESLNGEGLLVDFRLLKRWTDETLEMLDHRISTKWISLQIATPRRKTWQDGFTTASQTGSMRTGSGSPGSPSGNRKMPGPFMRAGQTGGIHDRRSKPAGSSEDRHPEGGRQGYQVSHHRPRQSPRHPVGECHHQHVCQSPAPFQGHPHEPLRGNPQ